MSAADPATGGSALAAALVAGGVDTVFGVPGAQLDAATDGLARDGRIRFVHCRHEQGAAYLADGYARASGRTGVAMVVPGPGLLNAGAGLATAWACSSPVLAVVGQVPQAAQGRGYGVLHEIADQDGVLRGLTTWCGTAATADDVAPLVAEALHRAPSGRPRPVGVQLAPDVLAARTDTVAMAPAAPEPVPVDPDGLAAAVRALAGAARPVVVAGGGVVAAGASAVVAALAERLGAPVVTTLNGRGAVPEPHPLTLAPTAGREVLAVADVVLAIGTRAIALQGAPIARAAGSVLVMVDADPDALVGRGVDVPVPGDARLAAREIAAALPAELPARREPWLDLTPVREHAARQIAEIEPQASFVAALRAALPDDGVLVTDLTQVGYLAQVAFPVRHPRGLITSGFQGTLGYAYPAALGAQVALPDRAVVAVCGDGGFGFTLGELATAARHRIPAVAVVFADGAFGNVRRTQDERYAGRRIGTDLADPDHVALARAFGVAGRRAESPIELETALKDALAARAPAVIEVSVGAMPSPWHLLTDRPTGLLTGGTT